MEQLFQLNIQTPTKAISMQTTNPEDVINMMKLSGQQVVSHDAVAIDIPVSVSSEECSTCGSEECDVCGMEPCECHQAVGEEYENTPDATRERNPRSHGDITDFGAPGTGRGQPGSALNKPSGHGDNPLTFEGLSTAYSKFKKTVAESYTGRETKDGVWRVFKTGNSVAVAGPFDCKEKASAWISKQKKSGTKVDEGYWQDAVNKSEASREARKGKSFEKNPSSHDKNGVYKGDKDLAGKAVPKNKTKKVAEGSGSKEKQKTPYRDINSPEYKAAAVMQKQRMAKDKAAEPGKKLLAKQGVAEGLSKRDQKDVEAIKSAIERLETELAQPNTDKESIRNRISQEKKRLSLYNQGVAEAAQGHTIEAHGIRGMSRKPWRKTFKNVNQLNAWCEKYDAEVYGTRDTEAAAQGKLSPAMEGFGDTIKRGVKSVKRGMQGWDKSNIGPGGEELGNPRDIVRRNKGYSDDTVQRLHKASTSPIGFPFRQGDFDGKDKHSPGGLQKRVLDREMKKRGLGEQGVAEGSGSKEKQKTPPYRDINSPEYKAAADKQKQQMAKDKAAEPGKKLLAKQGVAEDSTATPGYIKYEQMKDKIASVLIRLYNQGKDAETIEKMGERVAKHLGYNPADPIYQEAWLTSLTDASADGELDNAEDEDDYTDYSMRQGEMGRRGVAESATSKKKVTKLR